MKKVLLIFISAYQLIARPLLGPRCRFYPSCSDFAAEAINRHGVWKGLGMSLVRLLCCHPFHPGGFDPVPGENRDSPHYQHG